MRYTLLLIILIPAISSAQSNRKFIDTAGYFTAQYPTDWVNKIKANNRVFFTSPSDGESDKFFENINISVTPGDESEESGAIGDMFTDVIPLLKEKIIDFKEESRRLFKWNNVEAAEIIYTGYGDKEQTVRIRSTQWYCYYKSRLYIATFVAEAANSKHNVAAKKIMNSILFQ